MNLTVVTAPVKEPVLLADARKHCRLDSDQTEHDWLLEVLISAARTAAEARLGRALIQQTLKLQARARCRVELLRSPVISVDQVKLIDADRNETTLTEEEWRVDNTSLVPVLIPDDISGYCDIEITYKAGYGLEPANVPAGIRNWMMVWINTHFEHRESVVVGSAVNAMPTEFIDGLLDPFKIPRV